MLRAQPCFLAALIVAGGLAHAQQQPTPTFRSNVELVEVDVVVRDSSGKPVRSLTKDDFTILDRNKPQELATFVEISNDYQPSQSAHVFPEVVEDVADNQSSQNERLIVIIVDDMIPRTIQETEKLLAREFVQRIGRSTSMALVFTSGTGNVEVTQDPARLLAAIDRVATKASGAPRVPEQQGSETGTCNWNGFEQAARMVEPEDVRRKAFVLFSPFCGARLRLVNGIPLKNDGRIDVKALDAMDALRRAKVVWYAVDPRGVDPFSLSHFQSLDLVGQPRGERVNPDPFSDDPLTHLQSDDPVFLSQENLRSFTGATSGFAITNTNAFEAGLDRIVEDLDHYYLLGFYPKDSTSSGYRSIEVKVSRPGLTLRYRRGYEVGRSSVRPTNKDPLVALATGVLPQNNLGLRLFATSAPTRENRRQQLIALEVGAPRAAFAEMQTDDLSATILAIDLKRSKVMRNVKLSRTVDLAPILAASGVPTIEYTISAVLDLPAGTYQLRGAASSARLARAGSVYLTIDVPEQPGDSFALGGIVLSRVTTLSSPTLLGAAAVPVEPTLDRVFLASDRLRVFGAVAPRNSKAISGTVEVLDQSLRTVHAIRVSSIPDGATGIDVTLALRDLSPGHYLIRVSATDGRRAEHRETEIEVKGPS